MKHRPSVYLSVRSAGPYANQARVRAPPRRLVSQAPGLDHEMVRYLNGLVDSVRSEKGGVAHVRREIREAVAGDNVALVASFAEQLADWLLERQVGDTIPVTHETEAMREVLEIIKQELHNAAADKKWPHLNSAGPYANAPRRIPEAVAQPVAWNEARLSGDLLRIYGLLREGKTQKAREKVRQFIAEGRYEDLAAIANEMRRLVLNSRISAVHGLHHVPNSYENGILRDGMALIKDEVNAISQLLPRGSVRNYLRYKPEVVEVRE